MGKDKNQVGLFCLPCRLLQDSQGYLRLFLPTWPPLFVNGLQLLYFESYKVHPDV